jgi:hypothetical protein
MKGSDKRVTSLIYDKRGKTPFNKYTLLKLLLYIKYLLMIVRFSVTSTTMTEKSTPKSG